MRQRTPTVRRWVHVTVALYAVMLAVTGSVLGLAMVQRDQARERMQADATRTGPSVQTALLASDRRAVTRTGWWVVEAAALLVVVQGGLLWRYTQSARRWVVAPLEGLADVSQRLALGESGTPIDSDGAREAREVAVALEMLRQQEIDLNDELRHAREALRQRAPIVSAVRAELGRSDAPDIPGLDVAARVVPAEGVIAGDWFDVLPLEGSLVAICLGDVSGHGADSGVLALQTKQLVTAALRLGLDPGKALGWTAEHLGTTGERFVTCQVLIVNPVTGSCRYANAGHPPAYLKDRDEVSILEVTGPLLGPYPGSWGTEEIVLRPGQVLVLCTDGLLEIRDEGRVELGIEGLRDVLRAAPFDVAELVESCLDVAKARSSGALTDDVTVLALSRPVETGDAP